jgi:hypothetical protein
MAIVQMRKDKHNLNFDKNLLTMVDSLHQYYPKCNIYEILRVLSTNIILHVVYCLVYVPYLSHNEQCLT